MRAPGSIFAVAAHHHHAPAGALLGVLLALVVLYVGWRTGRLRALRGLVRARMPRTTPTRVRISPFALVPLVILVIVVVLLVLAH